MFAKGYFVRRQPKRDYFYPSWRQHELENLNDMYLYGRIRQEFRHLRNWNLEELELHEDKVESEFSNFITRRTGLEIRALKILFADHINEFFARWAGLHIDEAYSRLLLLGRDVQERRSLSKNFLKIVGFLRMKSREDGSRDYGDYGHFVDSDNFLFINESGVITILDYDEWERLYGEDIETPSYSSFQDAVIEEVSRPKPREFRFRPFWDGDIYWDAEDHCYALVPVEFKAFGTWCSGKVWFSYLRLEGTESDPPCGPQWDGSLEKLYVPYGRREANMHGLWRCAPASCEDAAHLDSLSKAREG